MKRFSHLLVIATAVTGFVPAFVHGNSGTVTSIVPPGAPTSVFVREPLDMGFGKDPFFPKTKRFEREIPKDVENHVIAPIVPDEIALKGISIIEDRKLAIINTVTAAEGEVFTLRIKGQPVKVQCVEIKDKSVIISVNDATKELPLRASLQ